MVRVLSGMAAEARPSASLPPLASHFSLLVCRRIHHNNVTVVVFVGEGKI